MDETRALLDQLMGRERDIPVEKRTNRVRRVWDDDICKPYLCGACSWWGWGVAVLVSVSVLVLVSVSVGVVVVGMVLAMVVV